MRKESYIGDADGIIRFDIGDVSSGVRWANLERVMDLEVMPNGHILAMTHNSLVEVDVPGGRVRYVSGALNGRGVEFDPQENVIYASVGGQSGAHALVRKLDAITGGILDSEYFPSSNDMWLTDEGRLVVGSFHQSPGIFTTDLDRLGTFEWEQRAFVTQFQPIPEPSSLILLTTGLGALGLIVYRRRRRLRS